MRWVRPARLPLLIAWAVIVGVVSWLVLHPALIAPYASRMVSRHLLRIEGGGLQVRDFRVRLFEGMDLYGVSLTLTGQDGAVTLVSADTVAVDFRVREALGTLPRLRRVTVSRPEVYSRAGHAPDTETAAATESSQPQLSIDHLVVNEAYLEFSGADGRLTERISRLNWRGAVHAEQDVRLLLRGCDVHWDTHLSVLTGLRGEVKLDQEGVTATQVFGALNDHRVEVTGSRAWAGDLDLAVKGQGVNVEEVENLIDQSIGFVADGDIDGTFVTVADTLVYNGIFSGLLEGYEVRDLTGRAAIGDDEVRLSGLSGVINGASFTGGGRFDISRSDSIAFVLEGDVSDVDLTRGLVPGEQDLPQTDGWGRLRIEHTARPLWTRVSGRMLDGFVATIPFDTCFVDVEAAGDSLRFNHIDLRYRDLRALVTGSTDTSDVFRGEISGGSGDLSSLPDQWHWPDLDGRLQGHGELNGPVDDLGFAGWLKVNDFALSAVRAGYAEAALVVGDVLGDPRYSTGIDGRDFSVGDVPCGDFLLWGSASARGASVDSFRSVLGDTVVAFGLHAVFADTTNTFLVDRFSVDLEGTHWAVAEPTVFSVGRGNLRLPSVRLESDQGVMAADALYRRDEIVAGSLELRRFDLGLLDPFVAGTRPLSGRLSADVLVGGEPDAPVISLTGDLTGATFDLADVDSLTVAASFSQGVFDFRDLELLTQYGRVRGSGQVAHDGAGVRDFWPGAELDLDLDITQGDWRFLEQFQLPALDRLAGRFDGTLHVAGTTDFPLLRGDLVSAPFHIHWLHLDRLSGQIWADSDELILSELQGNQDQLAMTGRIEIPMELDFLSEPMTPPDGAFYMQLDIPEGSDLQPLFRATNAFFSSEGTGQAHVVASGPLEHPSYRGSLQIDGAGFVLRNLEEIYYDASCSGYFTGDELRLINLSGREGARGSFDGEGTVRFNGLDLETFDVRLNVNRFLVASVPDLRAVVSGENCRLSGVKVGPDSLLVPRFSGDLTVLKGRYVGDFSGTPGLNDPRQATVAPNWLANLRLHGDPRTARIVNQDMDLTLGGDLDLVRDEDGLFLRGTLDVNSGLLFVFNNKFNVLRGRLDFSREVGFDPRLDLDAETRYRLSGVGTGSNSIIEHIGVHVAGTMQQPLVSFSSERGYSREAIQRMLLGLEPQATPESDRQRLTATSINAGLNLVEREIARELDIFDTFEIDQIRRERLTGEQGLDPLIGVGKYIGSDLYLKYAQGIRQDDRDILVEYQINNHLLLQSEIRRRIDENQGQPTYNLDLKYRFEY